MSTSTRGSAGFWQQTWLLLQKNWRTKRRQETKALLGEILVPIMYLTILSLFVRLYPIKPYPAQTESSDTPVNILENRDVSQPSQQNSNLLLIHVVPDDDESTKNFTSIMSELWRNETSGRRAMDFKFYKTVDDLEEAYVSNSTNVNLALVLPKWKVGQGRFEYVIRTNPDSVRLPAPMESMAEMTTCRQKQQTSAGLPLEDPSSCPVNGYFYSDFLALQSLVNQAALKLHGGESVDVNIEVTMENFPKREYQAGMPVLLRVLIPLYSVFPLTQLVNNVLMLIVTEKTNKVKDGLRMVGVSDGAYWLSWLGVYGSIVVLFATAFTGIFYYFGVIMYTDPGIVFLLFLLCGISVLVFAFALTPFFHKPKTAGLVCSLILQLSSGLFLVQTFIEGSERSLILLKLLSPLAFTTGIDVASKHEYNGGVSWADVRFNGRAEGILTSLLFLIMDIFIYGFLAFYLDNVLPNEFGVRKHPLFLFQPSYWTSSSGSMNDQGSHGRSLYLANDGDVCVEHSNYEEVSADMQGKEAITIRNVRKAYSSPCSEQSVEAVRGISLDIYEGQITAILGRNGAGKSTLFNILTGLVAPTSGRTTVFGLDSRRAYDMVKLRKILGVCLQQDLHFPSLTVEEHLVFYGKLRGMSKEELKVEVNIILHDLGLSDSRTVVGDKLSGGQKRKLSVGIALIGDPRVILLDEPTAGLDPVSRRNLWTLLQHKKEGKVILLTTHFMDEADILADRKAIMHDGVLRCVGSSLFLKNKFGVGYYLTVVLSEQATSTVVSDSIIEKWIPQAMETRKLWAREVKYALPHSEASKFPSLFADLEAEMASGESIVSFGVSMTTLEEVFLKISNDLDVERGATNRSADTGEVDLTKDTGRLNPAWFATFWALCLLRIRRLKRSPQALFFMIILPVIFTAGGFAVARNQPDSIAFLRVSEDLYKADQLRIAVHESGSDFQQFLNGRKIHTAPYSGNFTELLSVDPKGLMAALDIFETNFDTPNLRVRAGMRINGTFLHSPPLVVDLLTKYLASKGQNGTLVKPVLKYEPFRSLRNIDMGQMQSASFSIFLLGPAFAFSCIGMVMEIVHDREIKARNHLRVNGVTFTIYFVSIMATFGILSVVVVLSQLAMIFIFQVEAFMNIYAMTVLLGLLLLHLIPSQIFNILFSYLFDRMETAQTVFSQIANWGGSVVAFAVLIIDNVGVDRTIVRAVHITFCAIDVFYIPYAIFYWIIKVYIQMKYQYISTRKIQEINFSTYLTPEILAIFICMLVQIPVFWLLLVAADVLKNGGKPTQAIRSLMKIHSPSIVQLENPDDNGETADEDIVAERSRVIKYYSGLEPNNDCAVAAKNLRKRYKQKKKKFRQALNGVNLLVEKGEVFGLLGHNGAGKTTTIKIITAEEAPDTGKVCLCGYDIKSNISEAFRQLGFCPQHDALWENITMREHLKLYAVIRGIAKENINKLATDLMKGLSIEGHADKYVEKLSGGTKRKLSYAMAMLGAPTIVLLDEPSTGMDPQSKRFLWNTILGTFKESRGAILTTHSMEEADILCTRIGIMVKGNIICIGSPQHLKDKFGAGYTMEIKIRSDLSPVSSNDPFSVSTTNTMVELMSRRPSSAAAISNAGSGAANEVAATRREIPVEFKFVEESFPNCVLLEAFGNRAVFFIAKDDIQSISQTFAILEQLKAAQKIEEYSCSQTTLEQVFLSFAKANEESEVQ